MKPIKAGDEIFTYYGYTKHPFPLDFPWYWKQYEDLKRRDPKEEL